MKMKNKMNLRQKNMDTTDVFMLLKRAHRIFYDGEWWNVTGFNEQECYLEHSESGDETAVSLEKLAKSNVDYYQIVKISDYTPSEKQILSQHE